MTVLYDPLGRGAAQRRVGHTKRFDHRLGQVRLEAHAGTHGQVLGQLLEPDVGVDAPLPGPGQTARSLSKANPEACDSR